MQGEKWTAILNIYPKRIVFLDFKSLLGVFLNFIHSKPPFCSNK